ncbi:MAG: ABC transporter substrate-binding protein, partial [Ruminococcus sp.]|nr:ABC transporter substrate-binding protein [Ruminococcus sp.]
MKLSKLISLAAVPVILSGCGNDIVITNQTRQTEISFSWWGNDARHDYTLEAIAEFEKLHPDIKVKCHYSEWSGYQARNNVQMVSHTESDVMQINYAWINQYSHDGTGYYDISQLGDYFDFAAFTEDDLEYGMQHGCLNAVPIALNTMTVYINETVYNNYGLEIPKTFDDFYRAAEVMNGECYPISMSAKSTWFFIAAYVGQLKNKDFMDNDGNILFDESDIQLMIETYCNLVNKKVIPQVEYFEKAEISSGKYAGVLAWLSDANRSCGGAAENGFKIH